MCRTLIVASSVHSNLTSFPTFLQIAAQPTSLSAYFQFRKRCPHTYTVWNLHLWLQLWHWSNELPSFRHQKNQHHYQRLLQASSVPTSPKPIEATDSPSNAVILFWSTSHRPHPEYHSFWTIPKMIWSPNYPIQTCHFGFAIPEFTLQYPSEGETTAQSESNSYILLFHTITLNHSFPFTYQNVSLAISSKITLAETYF